MTNRYKTTGAEGEFKRDSNERVSRNLAGIKSAADMDELELQLLNELYDEVLVQNPPDRPLTVSDLKRWHRLWLGNVYAWAGQERSVNLGKGGFQFASAGLLAGLLSKFEQKCLKRWTPCGNLGPRRTSDYSSWEQNKDAYIGAIHAGFSGDYGPMGQLVAQAIADGNASLSELA